MEMPLTKILRLGGNLKPTGLEESVLAGTSVVSDVYEEEEGVGGRGRVRGSGRKDRGLGHEEGLEGAACSSHAL